MMVPKATGLMLGYARVSTDGQSLDAQEADLKSAGGSRCFVGVQEQDFSFETLRLVHLRIG
jgi:DNA invertase Pin-like site-specific DNA recombinase